MEEANIRGGFNFFLYYFTGIAFLVLLILNYYSRNIKIEALDIGLMISVVTFLFGFLVSIIFSMLLGRVSTLRDSLSAETGKIVNLFLLSKYLGTKFNFKLREKIDDYTIVTLREYNDYGKGREIFYSIYEDLELMELKSDYQKQISFSFLQTLLEMEVIREKLEYLTSQKVNFSFKLANYITGFLLIILLFLNRNDTFTNSLFIILSTIIIFILLIIEDFDSLRIIDYTANISNSEQLFDLIGKDRYYPKQILNRVKLEPGKKYRIGFSGKYTHEERIFSILYTPNFHNKIEKMEEDLEKKFSEK